jgi:hypothetical protein
MGCEQELAAEWSVTVARESRLPPACAAGDDVEATSPLLLLRSVTVARDSSPPGALGGGGGIDGGGCMSGV